MQTIDHSSIKSIKTDQDNNIIYCLEYGCLLIWEQDKSGKIIPCANKLKALEQIFEQTNELNVLVAYLIIVLRPNMHKKDFIERLISSSITNAEFDQNKIFIHIKNLSQDIINSTPYSSYYSVCRA